MIFDFRSRQLSILHLTSEVSSEYITSALWEVTQLILTLLSVVFASSNTIDKSVKTAAGFNVQRSIIKIAGGIKDKIARTMNNVKETGNLGDPITVLQMRVFALKTTFSATTTNLDWIKSA